MLFVTGGDAGQLEEHESEMVILSMGMEAPADMRDLQNTLNLQKTPDDFYQEAHPSCSR